jgi:hypothetical protein
VGSGAGRVEQAVRAQIAAASWPSISVWHVASDLGWGTDRIVDAESGASLRDYTRSQYASILRAIHRVIDGQPGWKRVCRRRNRDGEGGGVEFVFTPPPDPSRLYMPRAEALKLMRASINQRPVSRRQRAKHRAAEPLARRPTPA